MPYEVSYGRNQRMTFSSSGSNNAGLAISWHQDFYVDVVGIDPLTVSSYDILSAPGIPLVNYTIWATETHIMPYVVCREKTAEQDPRRLSRWTVKCKYATPSSNSRGAGQGATGSQESENVPIPIPETIDSFDPVVTVALGETQRVLYFEKGDFPLWSTSTTPTGNFWSEPVLEKLPTFEMKITQYETSISYDDMVARKFKINRDTYRGQPNYMWLITQVEASDVSLTTTTGTQQAAMVTYTLSLSPDTDYGWREVRGLFDTQYLDAGGSVKMFQNEQPGTSTVGYVDINGNKRAQQSGEPDYVVYEVYDMLDFNDFLK